MSFPAKPNFEKRPLAILPTLHFNRESIKAFPRAFETYINDNFGFRENLLNLNSWFSTLMFKQSVSSLAIIGKQNWLFFTGDRSIEDIQRKEHSSDTVKQQWNSSLFDTEKWLTSKGIKYRFIVAPDKHFIYPEFLPPDLHQGEGKSRLQDLLDTIGRPNFFIYLQSALIKQKTISRLPLYFSTDTHWTSYGAYIGYIGLMQSLDSQYQAMTLKLPEASFHSHDKKKKDLAIMARMPTEESDLVSDIMLRNSCQRKAQILAPSSITSRATACSTGRGTVLVFHDSFMLAFAQYLSSTFARVVFLPFSSDANLFVQMVEQEKPDIVIQERVERALQCPHNFSLKEAVIELSKQQICINGTNLSDPYELIRRIATINELNGQTVFIINDNVWGFTKNKSNEVGHVEQIKVFHTSFSFYGWTLYPSNKHGAHHVVISKEKYVIYVHNITVNATNIEPYPNSKKIEQSRFNFSVEKEIISGGKGPIRFFSLQGTHLAELNFDQRLLMNVNITQN